MKKIFLIQLLSLLFVTLFGAEPIVQGKFAFVEGGKFFMGQASSTGDESPIHEVQVNSFFIYKTEVTQKEWLEIMKYNNSHFVGPDRPVENVSWYEATVFCNMKSIKERLKPAYELNGLLTIVDLDANGYRLPTEAEWEYAARGGLKSGNTLYSGSPLHGNVGILKDKAPVEVATKNPNELGIYDMTGNVAEWCWDWYDYLTYSLTRKTGLSSDPTGAFFGDYRVIRGGSWESETRSGYVSFRSYHYPYKQLPTIGFRVVRSR